MKDVISVAGLARDNESDPPSLLLCPSLACEVGQVCHCVCGSSVSRGVWCLAVLSLLISGSLPSVLLVEAVGKTSRKLIV